MLRYRASNEYMRRDYLEVKIVVTGPYTGYALQWGIQVPNIKLNGIWDLKP